MVPCRKISTLKDLAGHDILIGMPHVFLPIASTQPEALPVHKPLQIECQWILRIFPWFSDDFPMVPVFFPTSIPWRKVPLVGSAYRPPGLRDARPGWASSASSRTGMKPTHETHGHGDRKSMAVMNSVRTHLSIYLYIYVCVSLYAGMHACNLTQCNIIYISNVISCNLTLPNFMYAL